MSALDAVSNSSANTGQYIPIGKTQRGWDAFQRLNKVDQPGFRPIMNEKLGGASQINSDARPHPLPQAPGADADGFARIKPGQSGFDQSIDQNDKSDGLRPVKSDGELEFRPLPQQASADDFRPIKPGQFGVFGGAESLESRKDLFTGTELNPSVVQGKSVEAAELRASEAAQKLVSSTLVEPILKQLRETNNAAAPFGPTDAEKQFGPILDGQLAEKIVTAADFPLVERIKQDLMKNSSYVTQAEQASAPRHETANTKPLDILG